MQMGHLGQGSTGERFRIIAQKGARRVSCPRGTTQESSGRLGTGQQYVWCHRAATFAPPPRTTTTTIYHAPTTTVSPSIQAQISPQVSPVLTQQQASPGAGVSAGPTQYQPGGQQAGGMTAAELQAILAAQRRTDDARRAAELQSMQQQMATRDRLLQEQRAGEQRAIADREAARRAAEAEAMERARESAGALPPTAGAFVPPSPLQPPIFEPGPPLPVIDAETAVDLVTAPEGAQVVPYVLLAAAAVGAAFLLRGKKGAKKR